MWEWSSDFFDLEEHGRAFIKVLHLLDEAICQLTTVSLRAISMKGRLPSMDFIVKFVKTFLQIKYLLKLHIKMWKPNN